jgi:predicted DNA-binding protein with PD1-like motif
MTESKLVNSREIIMGKLSHGCDLLEDLTRVCVERNIRLGRIAAIGAVKKARIGYYNQKIRTYQFSTLDRPMEILNLTGNISLKDGNPFVHAHVTLADEEGKSYGGHLAPGSIVFACEFILEAFDGPDFNRCPDEETGLPLWSM